MTCQEKQTHCRVQEREDPPCQESGTVGIVARRAAVYDPELLYVECRNCGKPLLWEPGKTTELLQTAGVDLGTLDESCLIVSEGCPRCQPGDRRVFALAVVRIAGLTPEEAVHMSKPAGSA